MILVPDFVAPAAEAAAGVDVEVLQLGQELLENAFALESRGRVTVIEAAVVGGDNLVGWAEHFGVEEPFDAVAEHVVVVDRLHAGFGNLEHDGPVGAFLRGGGRGRGAVGELHGRKLLGGWRLIVRRVIREYGGAVEGAVVFGEIEPAFIANALGTLAADANADDVR